MAITRSDLRNKIRNKLKDWWVDQDTTSAYLSAATTTLSATTGNKYHEGDIIEVESEVMKITSATSSNNISVIRGYEGTTAAAHALTSTVYIVDQWTSTEINDAITESFNALYPYINEPYVGDLKGYGSRLVLDTCDAIAVWSASADAGTHTLNQTDEVEGSGCLNLGATYSAGNAYYSRTLSTAVDATDAEYLNLWIYVTDKWNSTDVTYYKRDNFATVKLGNDASNYGSINISFDDIKEDSWTLISININDMTTTGTWTKSGTDYLEINFHPKESITVGNLLMDEWYLTKYPMSTNKLKYRLPTNVYSVSQVKLYQSEDSTDYTEENRYIVDGDYIVFRRALDEAKPMQLIGQKKPVVPTADTTTIDLETRKEELVILYASLYLFENMISQRTRFTRYSAKLNKGDMSVLDVIRGINNLRSRYNDLLLQFNDPGKAINIDLNND